MENAAHGESLDHEVYRTPWAVQPEFEYRATPQNYRNTYRGPAKLPDKIKVWCVQDSPKGNVVARSSGFTDSPDAEIIAVGFNHGKEYGAIGIGRHGNFLQWGYGDTPSQMTEAGRRLFINCIHYIHRFDGKPPLVRRQSTSDRSSAMSLAGNINIDRGSGDRKRFFLGLFPEALYAKYGSDPKGLRKYYEENVEWIYLDRVFKVDEDVKGLGIDSNRRLSSLQRLIEFLDDAQRAATAKQLLGRYTDLSFETPQQWRQWFEANKDRIYFTDLGGYKFKVVPEGYLIAK